MPALLMSTSSAPTSRAACWISATLVTSSVMGVTRVSAFSMVPRVPAYTRFTPRRSASLTSAWPMPRLAPVIKTVLFESFMSFLLFEIRTSVCYYAARKAEDTQPDLSGDFARNDGARGRQNPGAVDVIHDANDSVIRDFETDEGSRRPPAPIPEVDDNRRVAIR